MVRLGVAMLAGLTALVALGGPVMFVIAAAYVDLPSPARALALGALFACWAAAPIAALILAWRQRARGPGRVALILGGALGLALAGQALLERLPVRGV